MARCRKCSAPLPKGAEFCIDCGMPVREPKVKKKPKEKPKAKEGGKGIISRLLTRERKKLAKKKPKKGKAKKPGIKKLEKPPSPYLTKKPPSPISVIMIPLILVIVLIVVIALFLVFFGPVTQAACQEDWGCGPWSDCVDGQRTRVCADLNECGTEASKPPTQEGCLLEMITEIPNETEEEPKCAPLGDYCENADDCCSDYCLHNMCRNTTTFCGDGYCDAGEDCSTCEYDCGECPTERELEQNVYTDPVGYFDEQALKEDGYVLVRYFYSDDCGPCFSPVHIENQLRELAANFKDLFVLIIIDVQKYRNEANRYAKVGGMLYTPFIRVEGIADEVHGYDVLYGYTLGQELQDGDVIADVAPLICEHSDYCVFEGNKIVRT